MFFTVCSEKKTSCRHSVWAHLKVCQQNFCEKHLVYIRTTALMMNLVWDDCWDSAGCGQFYRCLFCNCALCGECFSYHWRIFCYNTAGQWPLGTCISSMNMGSILSSRSTLSTITVFLPVGFLVHHKTVDWMSQTVDSSKHSTHPEIYNNNNKNVIKSTRQKMWHLQLPHSNSRLQWRGGV